MYDINQLCCNRCQYLSGVGLVRFYGGFNQMELAPDHCVDNDTCTNLNVQVTSPNDGYKGQCFK